MSSALKIILNSILILLSMEKVLSQNNGQCPKVKVEQNFDERRASGRWYEIELSHSRPDEFQRCTFFDYVPQDESGHSYIILSRVSVNNNTTNILIYLMRDLGQPGLYLSPNNYTLNIVKMDYQHFAVFYACKDNAGDYLHIYSREPTLAPKYLQEARRIAEENSLPVDTLMPVDQQHCPPRVKVIESNE